MKSSLLLSSVCALLAPVSDPPPPPGGFTFTPTSHQVTYSDGYRTELDILTPNAAVPATGWPCAVVVHGGGGHRRKSWVITVTTMLARAGYVTLAYDTGNNGATVSLNPGVSRSEDERIRDLAEIVWFAEQQLGATMDERRLAAMGKSGGGKHALWAAAYSQKPLPVTGWVTHMPRFLAVHSDIQVLDQVADNLYQDVMFNANWAVKRYENLGAAHPVTMLIRNADYAGTKLYLESQAINYFPLLQQSDVPIYCSYAYDDHGKFVNTNADSISQLKPGVPYRYYQATGGHGSRANGGIGALRRDYTRRWFDHFVKGRQNGVVQEPWAEISVLPYDLAEDDWKHRRTLEWPIRGTHRRYLRTGGQLAAAAPAAIEVGPVVEHRIVTPGYDMLGFMQDGGDPLLVLNDIPLVTASFDTPPVTAPQEIFGRAVVELEVINSAPNFQLQAALIDVGPGGQERFITCGVDARRQAVPGRHRMRIELGDVGYILQADHSLRLSLENLNLHRQPGNPHFYVAPDFEDCDIDVQIDPSFAPRIDLPMGPARASLTARLGRASAGPGFTHDLDIQGESSRAGAVYQVFIGASGTWPGLVLPPHLPLNPDPWTLVGSIGANSQYFQSFVGVLDAQGRATATFAVLAPALATQLEGQRFSFAVLGLDSGLSFFATNPAELIIDP